jgi:flagellar biosynthesis/type III secretory pathway protein FliH
MKEDDEDPSDEYIKAFNAGYQMSKYEPELLEEILKSQGNINENNYFKAMAQGKEQGEHEKLMEEMKQIRQKQKTKPKIKR